MAGKWILELQLSVKQEQMSNLHCRQGVEILCLPGGAPGVSGAPQCQPLFLLCCHQLLCSYDWNSQISKALAWGLVAAGL